MTKANLFFENHNLSSLVKYVSHEIWFIWEICYNLQ